MSNDAAPLDSTPTRGHAHDVCADSPLDVLLAALGARRVPGVFAFAAAPADQVPVDAVVSVREREGCTVVLERARADFLGLDVHFEAAMITLTVHSDLAAVGLTAAVAGALAEAAIACNVVAGLHHDHLFVPLARAGEALAVLEGVASAARRRLSARGVAPVPD